MTTGASYPCAVRVRHLWHRFGALDALRDVSFDVQQGDIFGLIGPNGAGKTTLIRILATLVEPTAGTVEINGCDVATHPDRARRAMGYMSDQAGIYERLSVREYLEFFAAAAQVTSDQVVEAALELTDLDKLQDKLVSTMSKGMKQRLQVARVLLNDPDILLLDEPASDLDPRARIEMRDLLTELQSMGKTVFLSSHILSELADVCTSVAIVDRGTLVVAGPIGEIRERLQGVSKDHQQPYVPVQRLKLRVLDDPVRARELLLESPVVRDVEMHLQRDLIVSYEGHEEAAASLARLLVIAGLDLVSMDAERTELERIFLEVTKGELQ